MICSLAQEVHEWGGGDEIAREEAGPRYAPGWGFGLCAGIGSGEPLEVETWCCSNGRDNT